MRGDQDEIGGEQGRAQQAGDARRPVDDDVIGVAGELGRFAVQRVARQADDAEQARHGLLGALRGPVERRPLRVGVDDRDPLSLGRPGPAKCRASVVLPTPPFWLRSATIIAAPPSRLFPGRARRQQQKS